MENNVNDVNSTQGNQENPTPEVDVADEFVSQDLEVSWVRWKCLNCGYVYEGAEKLSACPRCGNSDPDKFADID